MAQKPSAITLALAARQRPQFNPINPIVGAAKAVGHAVEQAANAVSGGGKPADQNVRDLAASRARAKQQAAAKVAADQAAAASAARTAKPIAFRNTSGRR